MKIKLRNIDPEDIEDLLSKVETSFDIEFSDGELSYVKTFGEMVDYIKGKITLDKAMDCSKQQAFYKLRKTLQLNLDLENKVISPTTLLEDLLPKKTRREQLKNVEESLGFSLSILRPPHFVQNLLFLALITSIVGMFFSWKLGLVGLVFSALGFQLAHQFGIEFDLKTVGEVAEKMTHENYLNSRRNPKTYNENEIDSLILDWFANELALEKTQLTRDAVFG